MINQSPRLIRDFRNKNRISILPGHIHRFRQNNGLDSIVPKICYKQRGHKK